MGGNVDGSAVAYRSRKLNGTTAYGKNDNATNTMGTIRSI
jgi:hypothetical protein